MGISSLTLTKPRVLLILRVSICKMASCPLPHPFGAKCIIYIEHVARGLQYNQYSINDITFPLFT